MITDFQYKLTGVGWAEMTLITKNKSVALSLSYSRNPLPELILALCRLLRKESRIEIINLYNETNEHDILLVNIQWRTLKIDVIEDACFAILEPEEGDDRTPETILVSYDDIHVFSKIVADGLMTFINEVGYNNYADNWHQPFPKQELDTLYDLLKRFGYY